MKIHLDKDYEIKCTLGTIKDIETEFNKPFFALLGDLDKLDTSAQIKLIFVGVRRAGENITWEEFTQKCEDHLGLGDLSELIENFMLQLQYPGLSTEQIQKKIQNKMSKIEQLKSLTGQAS